jgi:hypothetical protein
MLQVSTWRRQEKGKQTKPKTKWVRREVEEARRLHELMTKGLCVNSTRCGSTVSVKMLLRTHISFGITKESIVLGKMRQSCWQNTQNSSRAAFKKENSQVKMKKVKEGLHQVRRDGLEYQQKMEREIKVMDEHARGQE